MHTQPRLRAIDLLDPLHILEAEELVACAGADVEDYAGGGGEDRIEGRVGVVGADYAADGPAVGEGALFEGAEGGEGKEGVEEEG